mgnify:CR=1 FL=1
MHQTSWGVTTRLIGALIMVHGDNSGLVLPPKVAPTQVVIIPIQQRKEGVLDKAYELKDRLSNFRVKVDDTDKSPGWKFAEAEMRGIPVRVEIGPKDIEAGKMRSGTRDTGEKARMRIRRAGSKDCRADGNDPEGYAGKSKKAQRIPYLCCKEYGRNG